MRWANKQNTVNYGQRGKKKHRYRQTCQRDVWILFIIWVQHAYRARLGTGSLLMPYFCASLQLVTGRRVIQRSLEIHQFIKEMKVEMITLKCCNAVVLSVASFSAKYKLLPLQGLRDFGNDDKVLSWNSQALHKVTSSLNAGCGSGSVAYYFMVS